MAGDLADKERRTISIAPENTGQKSGGVRELSPAAVACAGWFRKLARALMVSRLYKTDNSLVQQSRGQALDLLAKLIAENQGWLLRFTATEILLGDEPVVRQKSIKTPIDEGAPPSGEDLLPFIFYRDGVRAIRFPVDVPREELEALFEALKVVGGGPVSHDDLVTMLWQANLVHIQVESVPLEQTIYLSSHAVAARSEAVEAGEKYVWSPVGDEIHANIGQAGGGHGLHRDTFDDWELADGWEDVPTAYQQMAPWMEYSRAHFQAAWEEENARDWTDDAPDVLRELLALDPSEDTRLTIVHAVVTWIGGALQRSAIEEAQRAVEVLREFDPDRSHSGRELKTMLSQLDPAHFTEYLDEAEAEEQARFSALSVALGPAAIDLSVAVMVRAQHSRTRAAACSALSYMCADEPGLLAPYVTDSRGDVVLQVVFVLGQIGGAEVTDLLRLAAQHADKRVRRQVVQSLGGVPAPARIPALLEELRSGDPQLVIATLGMLARERNPRVARVLVDHIARSEFEANTEEMQRAWFSTLAEVADDEIVATLGEILNRGGWFAKRSFLRNAVARTLARIGTQAADTLLENGRKSRAAAVRSACTEALNSRAQQ